MDNPHPISIGVLVSGLMSDLRCLLRQEMELARHELQHERHKLSSIVIQSGISLLLGVMATLFLLMMGVHLLLTYTNLPLWACYGIVGFTSAVGTGGLMFRVVKVGASLRYWPFRTFHSLKEDVRWITERVLSNRA
ncbi:MAG: phage holin family protein [Nitrospira sp.]|nr:phage holin family protein [Nitrospira sp.]